MKKLMLMTALVLVTAVAQSGMVIRRVEPEGRLSQIDTWQFIRGHAYQLVVYLKKNHEQKVYSGVFVGYALVNGIRKTPTEGVVFSSGKGEAMDETAGKIYYVFKGPHTALLYRANIDWLIVQSAAIK